jgi:predicted N-acetyltransferase YhbS
VPQLRPARRDEIAAILRESYGLWGAGLTYSAYLAMWLDLLETPWGKRRFRHLVSVDGNGEVLSSLKLYRPVVRLFDRTGPAAVIGAVFTPKSLRGRGHAAEMIRSVLAEVRLAGDPLAMLFSDIGTSYYAALGFRALPADESSGTLDGALPAPAGWELRPMTHEDLPDVIRAHDDECASRPLAVLRDREHWEFLLTRAEAYFSRLDGSDLARRYRVAVFEGRFAGYLVSLEGQGSWLVREAGAPGADPGVLSTLLRLGAAEARRTGLRKVRGWLPPEVAKWVPEWRLVRQPRRSAIPMLLALDGDRDLSALDASGASFLPYLDQF